ncbi:WD40 repeat domain-containing protein [Methylosinus sp. H3A]|uniref:WD40 repeat domain-containing protein n=1 Tax=Methylosinus sp. H3A TaxID=2785786 RepID=UPI0018C2FE2F|nr:WD40 repeat domain-containing protein [Methylosinus sp. H3A]MBG0808728.1 WD40 repeat domain-containing protein [Methylosinus sp. H3A]
MTFGAPASLTSAFTPFDAGAEVVAAAFLGDAPVLALADGRLALPGEGADVGHRIAHSDGAILVVASDGKRLITGGDDGLVIASDLAGREIIADEKGKWIDAVAARADGTLAWSVGRELRTRSPKGEARALPLPSSSRGIAFFPKGYRLAIAHYNGVSLWFPNAGAPEFLEWKGSHLDVVVSPDGRFVLTSMQENMLHGWRVSDGKNMRMAGYPAKTRSLSWSHDGKWLATSGADACVVWPFQSKDGPMGEPPRECGVRPEVKVTRVAFHPSALAVAIGYEDGMVLLCRLTDASELLVRRPDEGAPARISALCWDAKGTRLAVGAENGAAGVLTLPTK